MEIPKENGLYTYYDDEINPEKLINFMRNKYLILPNKEVTVGFGDINGDNDPLPVYIEIKDKNEI